MSKNELENLRIIHGDDSWNVAMLKQAKEMENEQMRSYIEEKWKQYRMVTNEEDAWLFKEWLIQQTYEDNK